VYGFHIHTSIDIFFMGQIGIFGMKEGPPGCQTIFGKGISTLFIKNQSLLPLPL
jgi:hypothetical protein